MRQQKDQVARIDIANEGSGTLIQHIRVDLVGPQQGHPALPERTFGLHLAKFFLHRGHLLVEVDLSAQAMVAGKGIDAEIADEGCGKDLQPERGQNGAAAAMRNHRRKMRQSR